MEPPSRPAFRNASQGAGTPGPVGLARECVYFLYCHGRGIFRFDPAVHSGTRIGGSDFCVGARHAVGSMLKEATKGRFGGLAIFKRALSEAEMKRLHDSANVGALR